MKVGGHRGRSGPSGYGEKNSKLLASVTCYEITLVIQLLEEIDIDQRDWLCGSVCSVAPEIDRLIESSAVRDPGETVDSHEPLKRS